MTAAQPADEAPATVLLETADRIDAAPLPPDHPNTFLSGARWATGHMRRIAAEKERQTTATEATDDHGTRET